MEVELDTNQGKSYPDPKRIRDLGPEHTEAENLLGGCFGMYFSENYKESIRIDQNRDLLRRQHLWISARGTHHCWDSTGTCLHVLPRRRRPGDRHAHGTAISPKISIHPFHVWHEEFRLSFPAFFHLRGKLRMHTHAHAQAHRNTTTTIDRQHLSAPSNEQHEDQRAPCLHGSAGGNPGELYCVPRQGRYYCRRMHQNRKTRRRKKTEKRGKPRPAPQESAYI